MFGENRSHGASEGGTKEATVGKDLPPFSSCSISFPFNISIMVAPMAVLYLATSSKLVHVTTASSITLICIDQELYFSQPSTEKAISVQRAFPTAAARVK